MTAILLIDFGSTYTKVTAVDLNSEQLLGTAAAYTTVQTDVGIGLENAIGLLTEKTGPLDFAQRYACSSAAGGLRMVTSGLVPELTAEAAKRASLGAGAKVIGVYSYQLTEDDIADIEAAFPDILLLTGGTDGGNSECILYNAKVLSEIQARFPIVIAGNRSVGRQCQRILQDFETHLCENVMPKFGELNIGPCQQQIRDIFLKRIIKAKGLSKASELISGIMMPTPSAMLAAMELLAGGCEGESGIGELIGVDVGGATTDIYSIASGMPTGVGTVYKGLPEPYSKRTVEGDIGMRYSVQGIVEAAGLARVAQMAQLSEQRTAELVQMLSQQTDTLPQTSELESLDFALASLAIETAVARHAGTMQQIYTPAGLTNLQEGKDLTGVERVVVTGGALIHTKRTGQIAGHALYSQQQPTSLRPHKAEILVDRSYILAAMGLLSQHHPRTALKIMKRS